MTEQLLIEESVVDNCCTIRQNSKRSLSCHAENNKKLPNQHVQMILGLYLDSQQMDIFELEASKTLSNYE